VARRIFIGDIQGCRDELERLLAVLKFDTSRDTLEPVGDFVNRGPDSLGTLRLLKSLGVGGVLGNHDLHLLAARRGERAMKPTDTLTDVLAAPDGDELLAWLRARPFIKTWPGIILVHAGLSPGWRDPVAELSGLNPELRHPNIDIATRIRWCDAQGRMPNPETDPPLTPGFRPWREHLEGRFKETIVFGHWARPGLVKRPGFRGLDTGCVWGGRLTAWIAEDDSFASVPAARPYSPF
jgi:bis(5'-nucleosyl)-tetraphosphatase (symmetrical)